MRWRMARAERLDGIYSGIANVARDKPEFVAGILAEVDKRGPTAAGDLDRALGGPAPGAPMDGQTPSAGYPLKPVSPAPPPEWRHRPSPG